MIQGRATLEGTGRFEDRFHKLPFQPFGRTGLRISQVGFGSYRIGVESNVHHAALMQSIQKGVNCIDTSSNYTNGDSERLISIVLGQMIAGGTLRRDEVIVVSKGGYLQGENYALSQTRKAEKGPWPELVEYSSSLEHCIHPEFLEDQITRSLERLQLETLDVYLLHNPEYYLGWAKRQDMALQEARKEYTRRLQQAFRYLETEVERGRIAAYGVSSNGFVNPPTDFDFTSVEQLWWIAQSISDNHHFSVVQMPMNLLETGAGSVESQTDGKTPLGMAAELGLGVMINRPLNAVLGNNLIRLANLPKPDQAPDEDLVIGLIEELYNQESRLQRAIFNIDIPFRTKQEFAATTAGARLLQTRWNGFGTHANWIDVRDGYLKPRSQFATRFLRNRPELPPESAGWIDEYEQIFEKTLSAITDVYHAHARQLNADIWANAGTVEPDWQGAQTLSQTAVRAIRSTTGVSTVLVGMRSPDYVADVLTDLGNPIQQKPRTAAWRSMGQVVDSS